MIEAEPQNDLFAEYSGNYRHKVDRSHRVALPVCWRPDGWPQSFVVARWPICDEVTVPEKQHLLVLTPERWRAVYATLITQSISDPKAAALSREIGSAYARLTLDKVGRLPLVDWLARDAGIEDEALLLGLVNRFEIWNPKRYAEFQADSKRLASEAYKQIAL